MKRREYSYIGGLLFILLYFCDARAYDFMDRSRGEVLYFNIVSSAERTCELTHGDAGETYEGRSYTIPRSVRYRRHSYRVVAVGKEAFAGCNNLTNITFHSHITRIDSAAFSGSLSLSRLRLPSKLKEIGSMAFYGCSSLSYVEIPASVEQIGEGAFSNCSGVVDITVDDKNRRYSDAKGSSCIIDTKTHSLIQGCSGTEIPSDITSVGAYAFA